MARGLAVVLFTLALAPAAARAGFEPLPAPPGVLAAFAASGDDWVGLHGSPLQGAVSRDGGVSWGPLPLRGVSFPSRGGLSVGPDRAVYAGVEQASGPAVLRAAPGGDGFDPLPLAFPLTEDAVASPPAWDAQKRMWVALADGTTLAVVRFNADGSVAERHDAAIGCGAPLAVTFAAGRLYARCSSSVFALRGGRLALLSGPAAEGSSRFTSLWPILSDGRTVLAERALSLDGGDHFGGLSINNLRPVHGTEKLLVDLVTFVGADDGGAVLSRWSDWLYRAAPLRLPRGTTEVWQVRQGLLAVSVGGFSGSVFALHRGGAPAWRSQKVPGFGGRMLARANAMRRAAGLPPLIGSRLIAKATAAHVRYVNARLSFARGINFHAESPGRGFTGRTPQDRCKRAGTRCGGEIINGGNQAVRPVDSWVATPYHRAPLANPLGSLAGAARFGRVAGMNFDDLGGVQLAPHGYPRGRYDGPLAFPGNETPDPIAACRAARQPVRNPGTPVTVFVPVSANEPVRIQVFQGRKRLRGCSKVGFFFPAAPLRPRTRYTARATWRTAEGASPTTYSWSFRTR